MTARRLRIIVFALLATHLTGCFTIRSYFDERRYSRHVESRAEEVWQESRGAYERVEKHVQDFGKGFVAGYVGVATGGDGCPPVLPPTRYWRTSYSNDAGKTKIVAWFDGYQHGAAAAMGDNAANGRRLLTSQEVYHNCRDYVEYVPGNFEGTTPIPLIIDPVPENHPPELAPPPLLEEEDAPELNLPDVPAEQPRYVPDEAELLFPPEPAANTFNPNIWRNWSDADANDKSVARNG